MVYVLCIHSHYSDLICINKYGDLRKQYKARYNFTSSDVTRELIWSSVDPRGPLNIYFCLWTPV